MGMKPREYRYDNLRFFLMALVVLGHLLEITPDIPYERELYYLIYSFHMPAFLFLSGIFARWDRIKVIFGMCVPYLVLQTLYIRFAQGLYAPEEAMQFSRPYWILWYLFVLAVYTLLIPLYDIASPMGRLAMVAAAVVLALAVGYDKSIGYQWSASRILVFQPWFLLGYYFKDAKRLIQRWVSLDRPLKYLLTELIVLGCIVLEYGLIRWDVPEKLLYGALSYADTGGSWQMRGLSMCCAASVIFLLFVVVGTRLDQKIPVLTVLGQNSLSIYLFHSFLVRLVQYRYHFLCDGVWEMLVLWAGILLLLGNPVAGRWTRFFFGAGWCRGRRFAPHNGCLGRFR